MSMAFAVAGYFGSKRALNFSQDALRKIFAIVYFFIAFRMMGWDSAVLKWLKGIF